MSVFGRASLVAQRLKHLPTMREIWVRSLGREDPWRRKWYPLQYSCLENPMPGRLPSTGSQRVGHDWVTSLSRSFNKLKTAVCCWTPVCSRHWVRLFYLLSLILLTNPSNPWWFSLNSDLFLTFIVVILFLYVYLMFIVFFTKLMSPVRADTVTILFKPVHPVSSTMCDTY